MKKVYLILLILLLQNGSVFAKEVPSTGEMFVDATLARPLGFIGLAIGSCVFVGSLPYTALSDNPSQSFQQSANRLIFFPFKYTFYRKLGEFYGYMDELEYVSE
jgi:hypothetical protein